MIKFINEILFWIFIIVIDCVEINSNQWLKFSIKCELYFTLEWGGLEGDENEIFVLFSRKFIGFFIVLIFPFFRCSPLFKELNGGDKLD